MVDLTKIIELFLVQLTILHLLKYVFSLVSSEGLTLHADALVTARKNISDSRTRSCEHNEDE